MRRFFLVGCALLAIAGERLSAQSSSQANPCRLWHKGRLTLSVQERAADTIPEIRVLDVRFEGSPTLALSEQNQIASELIDVVEKGYDGWQDSMQERVRSAWQVRGFLRVQLKTECRELSSSPTLKKVALTFQIEAGEQYHLDQIRFKNEKQFNSAELRQLFPISDGEIFNVDKIAQGIQTVREAYGARGFINFVAVPETIPDENQGLLLNVDLDEGKQFRISAVKLVGKNQSRAAALLRQYKIQPGEIFDLSLVDEFSRELGIHAEDDIERVIDEKNASVCLLISLPDSSD